MMNKVSAEGINTLSGGATAALGFEAAGVSCGIRNPRRDLALLFSSKPCVAAAVFTRNVVKGAP
ncbi:MAG: bifunctional ornithine acetyltransferase/N-acetylglutamate synthase, partial [Rubrobacteraceae bacterium]